MNRQPNINNMQYESFIDQHILHLQEIRRLLLRTREKMNTKFKKVRVSYTEFYSNLISGIFVVQYGVNIDTR